MKILFIGDISGSAGKKAVSCELLKLRNKYSIDYVIANAENTTLGRGLDWTDYNLLIESGVDFITMGNHTWHKPDIKEILKTKQNIIRPNNIKSFSEYSQYGVGTKLVSVNKKTIRITNLLGMSVTMKDDIQSNPFLNLQEIIENDLSDFHFVDFHCETTSEKNAMFLNFQGKVGAIFGTHTHVQTNDAKIINNTAYITDAGMTGARDGVIGAKPDSIIAMFKGETTRFRLEEHIGIYQFCAVLLEIDDDTNFPIKVEPITIYEK